MVGIIASRIGILRATRNSDGVNNYELKEDILTSWSGLLGLVNPTNNPQRFLLYYSINPQHHAYKRYHLHERGDHCAGSDRLH